MGLIFSINPDITGSELKWRMARWLMGGHFTWAPARSPSLTPNPSGIKQSPMSILSSLTTSQLNYIIAIKKQIEALQSQINSIAAAGGDLPSPFTDEAPKKPRRRVSAAGRARIAAAARARWAKHRGNRATGSKPARKGKRRLSAAGRAAIIAATKARWAKIKAAKKNDRRSSPAVRAKLAAAAKARWAKAKAEGKTTL
jgi:hypothetical protein